MKNLFIILVFFAFSVPCSYSFGQVPEDNNYSNNNSEVSYQTFYDQLQPYGNWIDYPGYGYVWQPNAGSDFRPYQTDGHWVSTVDGWAWASDYNWGWAPFHYGRWLFDQSIGWIWVPGYEWAPAWVTWGQYDNYYAWAPLAPGISISIGSTWRAPYNYWCFIPHNYIQYRYPSRYIVRNNFNRTVVNNITIINNYNSYNNHVYYHRGPDYREVERYTHTTIRPLAITPTQRPGTARVNQRQFEVYRPAIARNTTDNNRNAAPAHVRTITEVRGNRGANNPGNTYNSGANQNRTGTGSNTSPGATGDRNGGINNGSNDRYNNQNNTNRNADERVATPGRINSNQRAQTPYSNQPVTPDRPEITNQQLPQVNPQNNTNRAVITNQQNTQQNPRQFPGQRQNRMQHLPSNNQNQQYNQNQGQQVFQNNRNVQRGQNIPQQNNNVFRGQRQNSSTGVRQQISRPPVRNIQPAPMPRQQAAPAQRSAGGREHQRG